MILSGHLYHHPSESHPVINAQKKHEIDPKRPMWDHHPCGNAERLPDSESSTQFTQGPPQRFTLGPEKQQTGQKPNHNNKKHPPDNQWARASFPSE